MARLEIRPFSTEFIPAAGDLLAERHRAHRTAEPLLPERYEDPAAAAAEVEGLAGSEHASGSVALRGGRVVGYLLGIRKDDALWGPNVWVESAGHAAAEAEDVRDLYAAAAERWFEEGRVRHYALVPATDVALVDAWWRAGFGQQHAGGISEVPDIAWPDNVRRATEDDLDALVELSPVIADHQALAPVFGAVERNETEAELRADLLADMQKPEIGELVVEQDGRVVGAFEIVPVELSSVHTGLARPEGAALLGWAATFPDVRGSGAGVALTHGAFAWARERGHTTMVTDWRVTNLLSSRFWPKRGFRETFLRLYRHIP
jgi:GNAT superfamily N-acetyltransferase